MHIMSKLAKDCETASEIHHYERLEFLGDSVIEFLSRFINDCYVIGIKFRFCDNLALFWD